MTQFEIGDGGVALDFSRDWCSRHLEPLRPAWPEGAGIAMLLLFDAFAQDPRVLEMAPKDENGLASAAAVPRLVSECAPLCCFVGDAIADEIVTEALAGAGPRLAAIKARAGG